MPSEKAGVEAVSGRAQVQTAEMGEVIRHIEGGKLKHMVLRATVIVRSMAERELKSLVLGLSQMQCSLPPHRGV